MRKKPVCTSSAIRRALALVAEAARGREVLGGERPHTTLTLDDLDHDRRHALVDDRLKRRDVVGRHVDEALGQRPERVLLGGLARGREGRERAAVEASIERDDLERAGLAFPRPAARELDRTLDRLGAGVGEEHLPSPAEKIGHVASELCTVLHVEEVAHMYQLGRLLGYRRRDGRMRVAEVDGADAADEVEVLPAGVVVEAHALPAHEQHRLARVRMHDRFAIEGDLRVEALGHCLPLLCGIGDHRADTLVGIDLE